MAQDATELKPFGSNSSMTITNDEYSDNNAENITNKRMIKGSCVTINSTTSNTTSGSSTNRTSSMSEDLRFLKQVEQPSTYNRFVQLSKMMALMAVPIVALIVLSVFMYSRTYDIYMEALDARRSLESNLQVGELVVSLQKERSLSFIYIKSGGQKQDVHMTLIEARHETNDLAKKADIHSIRIDDMIMTSSTEFLRYLSSMRTPIDKILATFEATLEFYTKVDEALILENLDSLEVPNVGRLRDQLGANNAMLMALDIAGLQRALGATFFKDCHFNSTRLELFTTLEGRSVSMQEASFIQDKMIKSEYEQMQSQLSSPMSYIEMDKSCMWNKECVERCRKYPEKARLANSIAWFQNYTLYMDGMAVIRDTLIQRTRHDLNDIIEMTEREMGMYLASMVVVSVSCIILTVWYASCIHGMTSEIHVYAKKLSDKTKELKGQKKQAQKLLSQMLPEQIVANMKTGDTNLNAEFFESATVYFSDIVDFATLYSRVSAANIVDMLNALHALFDACIERYDVYKVETIGDTYMVCSGLPQRNGMRHVTEIARLAIEIVDAVAKFSIPQLPSEYIQIRVGIHTGSCVAGVVGTKIPRYCLFGDTVSIASRMESAGAPQRIQVSEVTRSLLPDTSEFTLDLRGDVDVKGKGPMKTYWLSSAATSLYPHINSLSVPKVSTNTTPLKSLRWSPGTYASENALNDY